MNFKMNELMNEVMDHNFETWSHTLNTADFVKPKFLNKIDGMVFVNLKKQLKEAEIYNLLYLQDQGFKLGIFQKLRILFSGLRPLYNAEKLREEQEKKQREVIITDGAEPVNTDSEQSLSLVNNFGVPDRGNCESSEPM